MKNKIFTISCILILTSLVVLPNINAQEQLEIPENLLNKMTLTHIKIDGYGSSFYLASEFILNFGRSAYMRFNLDETSHIEINKFLDRSNIIELDGNYIINILGFVGYFKETENSITLNGYAFFVFWR